jgi:uncharacterized protein (DUF111 family)
VWFNCCAGVAGDMLLAALIDAGADQAAVSAAWAALGIEGYAATWERVQRCGVSALWTNIVVVDHDHDDDHDHEHMHREAADVIALIESSDLPADVRRDAGAVYRVLAEVEGAIHGIDPERVELHEVGALDSIPIVGVCAASSLGVSASTIPRSSATDRGTARRWNPPNVAVARRAGASVTESIRDGAATPLALLRAQRRLRAAAAMTIIATGFGAGTADPPDIPMSCKPSWAARRRAAEPDAGDRRGQITATSPAGAAHTIAPSLRAGAFDAWATAIG